MILQGYVFQDINLCFIKTKSVSIALTITVFLCLITDFNLLADTTASMKLVLCEDATDQVDMRRSYHFPFLKVRIFDDVSMGNHTISSAI